LQQLQGENQISQQRLQVLQFGLQKQHVDLRYLQGCLQKLQGEAIRAAKSTEFWKYRAPAPYNDWHVAQIGCDLLQGVTIGVLKKDDPMKINTQSLTGRSSLSSMAKIGVIAAVAVVAGTEVAMAGADATFNTALSSFTGFLEGSGGKIITVLSLAGGIVGLASGRFSLGQVAIPVGVGVGAGTGVPIVTAAVTATI
jgi:conjugal transfer pilus assembly protein TraA